MICIYIYMCVCVLFMFTKYIIPDNTSSTAQGGGGSFKDKKPIGEELLWMHGWQNDGPEGGWGPGSFSLSLCLILCVFLSLTLYLSIYLSICLSI